MFASISFKGRPADNCCGAWHMWEPRVSLGRWNKEKSVWGNTEPPSNYHFDIDKYLPKGSVTTPEEFERYAWACLANAVAAHSCSVRQAAAFCQDGDRKKVDRLAEEMTYLQRTVINNATGAEAISVRGYMTDLLCYNTCDVVVHHHKFPSSHGEYMCNGYCITFERVPWRGTAQSVPKSQYISTHKNTLVQAKEGTKGQW